MMRYDHVYFKILSITNKVLCLFVWKNSIKFSFLLCSVKFSSLVSVSYILCVILSLNLIVLSTQFNFDWIFLPFDALNSPIVRQVCNGQKALLPVILLHQRTFHIFFYIYWKDSSNLPNSSFSNSFSTDKRRVRSKKIS